MRTVLADKTLEVAFFLLCWPREAARLIDPHLVQWARKTLAQNNELRPDQAELLQAKEDAHA